MSGIVDEPPEPPAERAPAGPRRRRRIRPLWIGASLLALLVAVAVAVAASAALDAPSKSVAVDMQIDAAQPDVWPILVGFDAYESWNPFIVSARGPSGTHGKLRLLLRVGGDERALEPSITVLQPKRKLRWQSRLGVPGLRDEELEVILEPISDTAVTAHLRYRVEGVLSPLSDGRGLRAALEAMAAALKARAEGGS